MSDHHDDHDPGRAGDLEQVDILGEAMVVARRHLHEMVQMLRR